VASHKFGKGQRTTKPKTSATLAMDRPWTIQNHVCHLLRHAIIPSYLYSRFCTRTDSPSFLLTNVAGEGVGQFYLLRRRMRARGGNFES
jgi:hypothetical protein